jgi:ADP-ribose pyrophosphatase YjhB (NUDIX family)
MVNFKRYSGVVVKNKNKVLLCKRSPDESMPNIWSIPAGMIENDETPLEAALREFNEETNIVLPNKLNLIGFINKYTKDKKTKTGIIYVYGYENNKDELIPDLKKAKDGHEHTKCQYFSQKDLPFDKKNDQLEEIVKKILRNN